MEKNIWNAVEYNKNSRIQYEAALNLLSCCKFLGNETVLDVGCGDGKLSAYISEKLTKGKVVGIDKSRKMIDFAKTNYNSKKFKNLDFLNKGAERINCSEKFDVVFSSFCIQWIINIEKLFRRFKEILKKGGRLILLIPRGLPKELENGFEKSKKTLKWGAFFKNFNQTWIFRNENTFRSNLSKVGFSVKICHTRVNKTSFQNTEDLKSYVKNSIPYAKNIPLSLREQYLEELVRAYLGLLKEDQTNKGISFEFPLIEIIAENPIL